MSYIFVGVDSGGVHLAAANNVPFVAIFNAIPPALRLSTYENYRVIFPEHLECAPCWDKGCKQMTCMREITPEVLASELEELVKEIENE
jgi:heptosyltransferase-2